MEKVVVVINNIQQNDSAYWVSKSVEERLNAIEFLRKQLPDYENQLSARLQRVCRVIAKTE